MPAPIRALTLAALLAVRAEGWSIDLPGFGHSRPPPRGRY